MGQFKLCITGDLGFEFWKNIEGTERYMISTYGNVWDKKLNKISPLFLNDRGYKIVHIKYSDGTDKKKRVHQLVGEAFLPKLKKEYNQINHKDEKKWEDINNRVENLEWCDCRYNNTYGEARKKCLLNLKQYRDTKK